MTFFSVKKPLNPAIALVCGVFVVVFGLVVATQQNAWYFFVVCAVVMLIFGFWRALVKVGIALVVIGGIFATISYFANGSWVAARTMIYRFCAILLGMVGGMSIRTVDMTRCFQQMRVARHITLGMLIAMSFTPTLRTEIARVREAMRTRGAGGILNIRILYRALLLPFVMRLVNISDTLALSVETRGFVMERTPFVVYRPSYVTIFHILYMLSIVGGALLVILL